MQIKPANRDIQGRYPPGISGNPNGRPRGTAGLADYIRKHTHNGRDLVDFLVIVAGDREKRIDDRLKAVGMLLERGWGRPDVSVNLTTDGKPLLVIGSGNGSTPTSTYP